MSAQAINIAAPALSRPAKKDSRAVESARDNRSIISGLPIEGLYQLYFAPAPTSEQIAMEEFLLECD